MANFLFIQSQDPFTDARTVHQYELIKTLGNQDHEVQVLLIQNGVTPARCHADSPQFKALLESNITIFADIFSLEQREIGASELKPGVSPADMDIVIDAMNRGFKVIWH